MNPLYNRYGSVALVTGASSGIGEAFVRHLVSSGFTVIGVARREDKLLEIAKSLSSAKGSFLPIVCDLSKHDAVDNIQKILKEWDIKVNLLVNNAGFGIQGRFEKLDRHRTLEMVDLNCRAVVDLTHSLLDPMIKQRKGGVIILSSVIGSLPAPWFSVYSATKAFDLYFGEALHAELLGSGVDVLTVLPGLTRTEFQAGAGMRDYHSPYRSAEQVVATAFKAMGKQAIVVDGWLNKLLVHSIRFLPRVMALWISRLVMKFETRAGRQ